MFQNLQMDGNRKTRKIKKTFERHGTRVEVSPDIIIPNSVHEL